MVSPMETPEIVAFNIEADDPYFAYSAKGVGEAPLVPVAAAIRNAIFFATGATDLRHAHDPRQDHRGLGKSGNVLRG